VVIASQSAANRLIAPDSLLEPHFSCWLPPQSDFGRSGGSASMTRWFRIFPKTRVVARRAANALRLRLETDLLRRSTMQKGTVKWFNPTKGYGFIKPATGDKDVFVHISAVERAGLGTLNEGQSVEYELVTNRGKTSAENLKVG
jgi:cold shock protein